MIDITYFVTLEIFFMVPQLNDTFIPFTRVNHKYMVTDNSAYYIGV